MVTLRWVYADSDGKRIRRGGGRGGLILVLPARSARFQANRAIYNALTQHCGFGSGITSGSALAPC